MGSKLKPLRLLRHLVYDERAAHRILDAEAQQRLAEHVAHSEAAHSGEIRLCIEGSLPLSYAWNGGDVRHRAVEMFSHLRVWDTQDNNGVLIYLLLAERRIEVVADRGVHLRAGNAVWSDVASQLGASFAAGHFEEGLHAALDAVTAQLVNHFPLAQGATNPNELSDQPVLR